MTGFKGRGENRGRAGHGGDNVIPFPSRPQSKPAAEPEFMEAIDSILSLIADPSSYESPLVTDLSMITVVALLRSAAGEPYALGPPDSPADIGDEPSPEEVAAAGATMVATLTDLALGRPMRWPNAPDARSAVDVMHALSLTGGPLADPARKAMAEHGFQPSGHMVHFDTAEVRTTYLITFQHGDAFELLFELGYPNLADDEPRPAYMVNLAILDGPRATAVHGAEDIGDLLETLATLQRSIDPTGPRIHHETVEPADALATLDAGLMTFNTTMGAAADPEGAEVGNQRLFMGGLLRRAPDDSRGLGRVLRPGSVKVDDQQRAVLVGQLIDWIETRRPDLSSAAAQAVPQMIDVAADRAGHPRRWTTEVAKACLGWASLGHEFELSPTTLAVLPELVGLAVAWSRSDAEPTEPVPGFLPPAIVEETLQALDEIEPMYRRNTPAARSGGDAPAGSTSDELFEPFDAAGIPEKLRARTGAIVEEASLLALTVFDDEFVTLVRRFTGDCARASECPFARGRFDLWASGVVYAVAQLNNIPGGWGPLSMDAKDLTDVLPGAHSTIVAKARDLRRLLGLERHEVDHEFLHSRSDLLFFGPPGVSAPMMSHLGIDPGVDEFESGAGFKRSVAVRPTGVSVAGPAGSRPGAEACFVLYVSLVGSKPAIWRRLCVPVDASFADLHRVLQLAFGWLDYHLHDFDIDGYRIGARMEEEFGLDCDADEATTTLGQLLRPGDQVRYTYDYGDSWEHGIVVEELRLDGASREHGRWAVLDGAMAGPPEDCGGVWGYRELLEARRDRRHPRHAEIMEWLPAGYDPERFDLDTVNQAVRNLRR